MATLGASVRVDIPDHRFHVRVGYLTGNAIDGEGPDFKSAIAHVGIRSHGRGFFFGEVGGTLIYTPEFFDSNEDMRVAAKWKPFPSLSVGAALDTGPVRLSVFANFPYVGAFAAVGVDLAEL